MGGSMITDPLLSQVQNQNKEIKVSALLTPRENKIVDTIRVQPRMGDVIDSVIELLHHKRNCRVLVEVSREGIIRIYNVNPRHSIDLNTEE
jgi:hypothetical protein